MTEQEHGSGQSEPRLVAATRGESAGSSSSEPEDAGTAVAGRKGKSSGRRGKSGKKPQRDGSERGPIGRAIRAIARALLIVAIITTGAVVTIVGYYASRLPPTADWTVPKRAANVRILAANGQLISNRGDTAGQSLSLDQMPPYVPEAVIAIEDRRFYWHLGIDPIGLARAAYTDLMAGAVVQGGSTLTQQLAKNLFLQPDRTFERKVQEVILALWLEIRLSKKQILELYLNRVYLGAGAYGVDAAAHRYFGKSARTLTLAEAATIAGLLKAPSNYSPISEPQAAQGRAKVVLAAMRDAGFINQREAQLAMAQKIEAVHDVAGGSGRYVADWVMDILPGYVSALDQDVVVETTINLDMQAAAAQAIADTLDEDGGKSRVSQGALVAIDTSGAVKALIGGRDYASSPFNRAVDGRRQPGSAFKPFVYLTALEAGYLPQSVVVDQPVSINGWTPENYERRYYGPVTLTTALAHSLNTVSAQLTAQVGPRAVAATAHRLGIVSPLMATPSIALGTSEVTLLELTAAFVPFANGGQGILPHVIDKITTAEGAVLYERNGSGAGQVIDPRYVAMMNAMMKQTVADGTGRAAAINGWPVAGKTGTSQDFRDAWFMGYTGVLAAGVWFGNDNNQPMRKVTGGSLPAAAWNRFMSSALAGVPVADLPGDYHLGPIAQSGWDANGDPIGALAADDNGAWPPPRAFDAHPIRSFLERLFGG